MFCEARPQSPIGEYFMDCLPGTAKRELPPGSRVPVKQTASTIPPDLIQNIMRLPYRERFRLILNEFGAGVAGRPEDLNEAVRRAVPALRQTSRLLEVLARHDTVIRDLVTDADTVLKRLSDNRRNVGRFVVEARDTASASAERRDDIRTNFRKLPFFLEELTPTMAALGEAAVEQRPVLVDLNASAGELRRFFDDTAELATASRPAIRSLGDAAVPGRQAVRAARPQVRELRRFARRTPDLGRNLRILLEDFDDPARAVERDPRSPGGRGYSGTQALLRYVFSQSQTINAFDELGYIVRTAVHTDKCSPVRGCRTRQGSRPARVPRLARARPARRDHPGPQRRASGGRTRRQARAGGPRPPPARRTPAPAPAPPATAPGSAPAPSGGRPQPPGALDQLLGDLLEKAPGKQAPEGTPVQPLLDYLLAP